MIRSYWYLGPVAAAAGLAALGPYGAPLIVVGLAFGIFFGTVSIRGRLLSPSGVSSGSHRPVPTPEATSTPPGA
jgi:hypothetical protein